MKKILIIALIIPLFGFGQEKNKKELTFEEYKEQENAL